jgi:hypothetical protein
VTILVDSEGEEEEEGDEIEDYKSVVSLDSIAAQADFVSLE